ncbi:MAG: nickel-dependent lactate racemase [Deltaproteobacteria bacterium]
MKTRFARGREYVEFQVPDKNLLGILEVKGSDQTMSNGELISQALAQPIGTPVLGEIIRNMQARNAVIVVNDITRPTPYRDMLPPLLSEVEAAGIERSNIELVVALGIHRPHTAEENNNIFGEEICRNYKVSNHDCDADLLSLGHLANGMELIINRKVAEADLLITTGLIGLHYFAGFSGGRKSILPGVAARSLIEANHRMMSDPRACLGNYHDNPVNDIMLQAARMAGVDFILNVVTTSKDRIVYATAGDLEQAWMAGVLHCEELDVFPIEQKAEIVIAGCGGFPKDINMYQSQKALDAAALAVKNGGTVLLIAECGEGLGEETFAEWIANADCPEDIERRFHEKFELGGHKAYAICRTLKNCRVMIYSKLSDEAVQNMFLEPVGNLQDTIDKLLAQYGNGARVWLMPEASKIAVRAKE